MAIQTRVFELAAARGFDSDSSLARAMRVSPALVSRVRAGKRGVNQAFIAGAQRAFPDKTLDELFSVETEPDAPAERVA
jgi:hypothetical protein